MAWEENSRICLHTQLIAILSRIGVLTSNILPHIYEADWLLFYYYCCPTMLVLLCAILDATQVVVELG